MKICIFYTVQSKSTNMSTYTSFRFPIGKDHKEEDELQVLKITAALKDVVIVALTSGFSKTSYLVQDHVRYIKRVQTANSPIAYVKFIARKLFPDESAYNAKIAKIRESYKGKEALLTKLEDLYKLYYSLPKTSPPKRIITKNEAEDLLAELLA